jgi:hypothetical protein
MDTTAYSMKRQWSLFSHVEGYFESPYVKQAFYVLRIQMEGK